LIVLCQSLLLVFFLNWAVEQLLQRIPSTSCFLLPPFLRLSCRLSFYTYYLMVWNSFGKSSIPCTRFLCRFVETYSVCVWCIHSWYVFSSFDRPFSLLSWLSCIPLLFLVGRSKYILLSLFFLSILALHSSSYSLKWALVSHRFFCYWFYGFFYSLSALVSRVYAVHESI
jgi:hypothetical protein